MTHDLELVQLDRGEFQPLVEVVEVMIDHCHWEVEWVIECLFYPLVSN